MMMPCTWNMADIALIADSQGTKAISAPTENGKKVLTMTEYIEREKIYELIGQTGVARVHVSDIDVIPSADVAPVRHGRWINWGDGVCCSVCESERPTKANDHKLSVKEVNFCYYCGAKMDLED